MQHPPHLRREGVVRAVQSLRVVQETGEAVLGGGAVALGEEQVAYGTADFQGTSGVVVIALEAWEEGVVFLQGLGQLAQLLQALGGLVAELVGLTGGCRALFAGELCGQSAEFGEGVPVSAVVHEGGGVLLAEGADHRGVRAVAGGGGRDDVAEDVDGLGDTAPVQEVLDLVDRLGDVRNKGSNATFPTFF